MCWDKSELVCLTLTGDNARSGGGATARFGAITGDNLATGVGLAAIWDTLVNAAVVGNLVCASCETQ